MTRAAVATPGVNDCRSPGHSLRLTLPTGHLCLRRCMYVSVDRPDAWWTGKYWSKRTGCAMRLRQLMPVQVRYLRKSAEACARRLANLDGTECARSDRFHDRADCRAESVSGGEQCGDRPGQCRTRCYRHLPRARWWMANAGRQLFRDRRDGRPDASADQLG